VRVEVLLQRVHVGALKWRLPAWWSSTPNPQSTSLGARDTDAGPMLIEESAALLTQLFVRRIAKKSVAIPGAARRQELPAAREKGHERPPPCGGRGKVLRRHGAHVPSESVAPRHAPSQAPWSSWTMATSMIK
jgi:hypothetical protein